MNRYLVPYLREFSIWRYGPRHDLIDGHYVDDGWYPDRFGQWEFRTEADAEAAANRTAVLRSVRSRPTIPNTP